MAEKLRRIYSLGRCGHSSNFLPEKQCFLLFWSRNFFMQASAPNSQIDVCAYCALVNFIYQRHLLCSQLDHCPGKNTVRTPRAQKRGDLKSKMLRRWIFVKANASNMGLWAIMSPASVHIRPQFYRSIVVAMLLGSAEAVVVV